MNKEEDELKSSSSASTEPTEEKSLEKKPKIENQKTYIDLFFCKLSLGILMTYCYITLSGSMTIINRIIFNTYLFKFNFVFLFIQQFLSSIAFLLISKTECFQRQVGEISIDDFRKLQKHYILFVFIFIGNTIIGFYGHQLVVNTPMFLTLRKLCTAMYYFYDIYFENKKVELYTSVSLFLITIGTILAGFTDFTVDYIGYLVVIVFNCMTVCYNKLTENFKKNTGVPNLKLLVYNTFLSCPFLLIGIIITGEYKTVMNYFDPGTNYGVIFFILLGSSLAITLQLCMFVSNEKTSSLFTSMMAQTQNIIVTLIGKFVLKGNKFTWNIIGGLLISTVGATTISVKSFLAHMVKKERPKNVLPK